MRVEGGVSVSIDYTGGRWRNVSIQRTDNLAEV